MLKPAPWLIAAVLTAAGAVRAEPGKLTPIPPPSAEPPAAASAEPEPAGFRITVPLCRRAEQASDPLAQTPECAQLLKAARDQAEACRRAFEDGKDEYALSPACRQAAGYR